LLEVEGPGDIGIVKPELCYILCSCFIFIFFLTFLWLLYSCENWIDLNRISLPLYLNIKPQIDLYIFTLGYLHSCTILTIQYQHPRASKTYHISYKSNGWDFWELNIHHFKNEIHYHLYQASDSNHHDLMSFKISLVNWLIILSSLN
jgi:hypothetical protein